MFCMTTSRGRAIFRSSVVARETFGGGAKFSKGSGTGSIPGTSVNFGRRSSLGGLTLNGAGGGGIAFFGDRVGTGGPLGGGTLSEADAPVPFGGRLKGMRAGPPASVVGGGGGGEVG